MAALAILATSATGARWKIRADLRARAGAQPFWNQRSFDITVGITHYFVSSAKVATTGVGQLTGVPITYRP